LLASKGVKGRLLLDKGNFFKSSCARQAERVREMFEQNVEIRLIKPTEGSGFASMHTKCWILDGSVVLDGSCNLTHGGLDNNIEHLYKITAPGVVASLVENFAQHWEYATVVTRSEIEKMMNNAEARKQHKKPSRSRSLSRNVSRSLSVELEDKAGSGE
jgi:phosphatidylserine/phosphatidylglycerophosphate/cardiolipin synthase-like enzyme